MCNDIVIYLCIIYLYLSIYLSYLFVCLHAVYISHSLSERLHQNLKASRWPVESFVEANY